MLAGFLALNLIGCGSEDGDEKNQDDTNIDENELIARLDPDDAAAGGGGTLSPWLFSLEEAQAISPLVLPFVAATGEEDSKHDTDFNAARDLIANFLSTTMKLAPHAPGRNFKVSVLNDEDTNAAAFNESLFFNTGLLNSASSLGVAIIACHEAAHSTRNHNSRGEKVLAEYETIFADKYAALEEAIEDLVSRRYDKAKGIFIHTVEDYEEMKSIWDDFWRVYASSQKKHESEADIVGGRICANAGFTAAEIQQGLSEIFMSLELLEESLSVEPGEHEVAEDELGEFLETIYGDSHPTNTERLEQLSRVQGAFVTSKDTGVADKWKSNYPANGWTLAGTSDLKALKRVMHRLTPSQKMVARRIQMMLDN